MKEGSRDPGQSWQPNVTKNWGSGYTGVFFLKNSKF